MLKEIFDNYFGEMGKGLEKGHSMLLAGLECQPPGRTKWLVLLTKLGVALSLHH